MKYQIIFLVILLTGCSAIGVVATNDPREKIEQAYALIGAGRPIPAERLANEAATIFEEKKDYVGVGTAYSLLGVLYSSSTYRAFEKYYREQGTYDPTPNKSMSYHEKAIEYYIKGGDYWGAANSLIGIGDGHTNQGNTIQACETYAKALDTYNTPGAKVSNYVYTWNPKYSTYKEMLEALVENSCNKSGKNA